MGRRGSRRGQAVDGLLLLDKPVGPTSHFACEGVRRALEAQKAGHTGTLDPMASGLLEICLGRATRLVPFLQADHKTYEATLRLGQGTDTLDAEGEVIVTDPAAWVAGVDAARFAACLPAFLGSIEQRPPAFSAIKVDGQRLHALARAGEVVEAPLRIVEIHELELVSAAAPDFTFRVRCGKGTYVRSLGRDIAAALGGHGHLVALRRLANGARRVDEAVTLDEVKAEPATALGRVLSLADAVAHLPTLELAHAALDDVRHGRPFQVPVTAALPLARVLDGEGRLLALVSVSGEGEGKVERGFPPAAP
ncbi:MAG: tRNA pseudouridine(55) synthase TruB [Myxococcales bacterium]|nr:tRNA pseudouridine(55) synthase TruB [Myxococcales bacterium]MCB9522090.1 tRNA pseudouridine(55) synthase TruB [Myxococcales bacterium]